MYQLCMCVRSNVLFKILLFSPMKKTVENHFLSSFLSSLKHTFICVGGVSRGKETPAGWWQERDTR